MLRGACGTAQVSLCYGPTRCQYGVWRSDVGYTDSRPMEEEGSDVRGRRVVIRGICRGVVTRGTCVRVKGGRDDGDVGRSEGEGAVLRDLQHRLPYPPPLPR
eukprot:2722131-Rhodomonas_salina.1